MWILSAAVATVGGQLLGADQAFTEVSSDSRVDCSGHLFIALRGEHFDGHDHVAAAQAAGAVAAMVDHPLPVDIPQWVVADTRLGLGQLAAAWRQRFAGRVIAITGSNGKTTVKEMLAAILAQVGWVLATRGNLNNDIGMPLTLLSVRTEEFLVLEMGANHPSEIGYLSRIAQPDVALITNAGHAHLEGFGSLDGVAAAKGEIAQGLSETGVLVVPGDAPYLELWRELAAGRQVLTFAVDAPADVSTT
ncbi:UDP-N-acetylmuramoyl-tripeptide--D-alanyl-D-alanine ligase, partial [Chromatium okenii]|uniref:UDP-N-acetylmuramoyl-tripeptide--D-alanyl-D- alanine ligase n=1 Tax=Chromatium okenii TaxID=61644 RepID=UPI0026ED9371